MNSYTASINDGNVYKNKMTYFEGKLKILSTAGGNTFLKKGTVISNKEKFYMHCIRFYIPTISRRTFSDHHLGFGVFSMKCYESRNKETKKTAPDKSMERVMSRARHSKGSMKSLMVELRLSRSN